jgi:hypothetical protein
MSLVERSPSVNVSNQGTVSDGGKWGTRVGSPLEEVRSRLLAIAARLEPQLDEHAQPLVAESRRVLQEQACRIAVIGQIKAGKSSFVNAFTHRPSCCRPTSIPGRRSSPSSSSAMTGLRRSTLQCSSSSHETSGSVWRKAADASGS